MADIVQAFKDLYFEHEKLIANVMTLARKSAYSRSDAEAAAAYAAILKADVEADAILDRYELKTDGNGNVLIEIQEPKPAKKTRKRKAGSPDAQAVLDRLGITAEEFFDITVFVKSLNKDE